MDENSQRCLQFCGIPVSYDKAGLMWPHKPLEADRVLCSGCDQLCHIALTDDCSLKGEAGQRGCLEKGSLTQLF